MISHYVRREYTYICVGWIDLGVFGMKKRMMMLAISAAAPTKQEKVRRLDNRRPLCFEMTCVIISKRGNLP